MKKVKPTIEEVLADVTELQSHKDLLSVEIQAHKDLLSSYKKTTADIKDESGMLKDLKEEVANAKKKLDKYESKLRTFGVKSKEQVGLSVSKLKGLEAEIEVLVDVLAKKKLQTEEGEKAHKSNMATLAEKYKAEEEKNVGQVDAKIAKNKKKLSEVEAKCKIATSILAEASKNAATVEILRKSSEDTISKLKTDRENLLSEKEDFDNITFKLSEVSAELKLAQTCLENVKKSSNKEATILEGLRADQEVARGWMNEKEIRIKKITSALAKKTDDASILRMLDNV